MNIVSGSCIRNFTKVKVGKQEQVKVDASPFFGREALIENLVLTGEEVDFRGPKMMGAKVYRQEGNPEAGEFLILDHPGSVYGAGSVLIISKDVELDPHCGYRDYEF